MNETAQWIVLLGFLVSLSLFVLAVLINQSTLIGQTTAEGVIEFPKNDIRDVRDAVIGIAEDGTDSVALHEDIRNISLVRNSAVVQYTIMGTGPSHVTIHFNNGVTSYDETTDV